MVIADERAGQINKFLSLLFTLKSALLVIYCSDMGSTLQKFKMHNLTCYKYLCYRPPTFCDFCLDNQVSVCFCV